MSYSKPLIGEADNLLHNYLQQLDEASKSVDHIEDGLERCKTFDRIAKRKLQEYSLALKAWESKYEQKRKGSHIMMPQRIKRIKRKRCKCLKKIIAFILNFCCIQFLINKKGRCIHVTRYK